MAKLRKSKVASNERSKEKKKSAKVTHEAKYRMGLPSTIKKVAKPVKHAPVTAKKIPPATPLKSPSSSKKRKFSEQVVVKRQEKSDEKWDIQLEALKKFKAEKGHTLVPKIYKENQLLSYWTQRNRKNYALYEKGKKSNMNTDRIQKLKDTGFCFRAKGIDLQAKVELERKRELGNKKWNDHYIELCAYQKEHGNCLVPKVFLSNKPLSSWVYSQRFQYKKKNAGADCLLNEERIKKLEKIGFCWKAKADKQWQQEERDKKYSQTQAFWDEKYKALLQFKKKHGHVMVPKVYKSDQALSSWVFRQRRQYVFRKRGEHHTLKDDRLDKLKKTGFVFKARGKRSKTSNTKNSFTDAEDSSGQFSGGENAGEGNRSAKFSEKESGDRDAHVKLSIGQGVSPKTEIVGQDSSVKDYTNDNAGDEGPVGKEASDTRSLKQDSVGQESKDNDSMKDDDSDEDSSDEDSSDGDSEDESSSSDDSSCSSGLSSVYVETKEYLSSSDELELGLNEGIGSMEDTPNKSPETDSKLMKKHSKENPKNAKSTGKTNHSSGRKSRKGGEAKLNRKPLEEADMILAVRKGSKKTGSKLSRTSTR